MSASARELDSLVIRQPSTLVISIDGNPHGSSVICHLFKKRSVSWMSWEVIEKQPSGSEEDKLAALSI